MAGPQEPSNKFEIDSMTGRSCARRTAVLASMNQPETLPDAEESKQVTRHSRPAIIAAQNQKAQAHKRANAAWHQDKMAKQERTPAAQ